MMTSGITFFLPFIFYISIYLVAYQFAFRHFTISRLIIKIFLGISIASLLLIKFVMPNENNFEEKKAFYFTCNKLTFWCNDIIEYLINKDKFDASHYSTEALNEAIQFYQKNQAFTFTPSTYPLLHLNNSNDVLGSFFNWSNSIWETKCQGESRTGVTIWKSNSFNFNSPNVSFNVTISP